MLRKIMLCALVVFAVLGVSAQTSGPDSREPDSQDAPVKAALGSWISRTIHQGDEDWFRVSSGGRGILILETDGDTDTVMELYDGSETVMGNDDGFGKEDNLNSRIEYYTGEGRTYTVVVRGYDEEAEGAYQFRALFEPVAADSTEPNETQAQASAINLGNRITGYFQSPQDVDWYRLTLSSPGLLVVSTEGNMDTLLSLYDRSVNLIQEDDDSGEYGSNARITAQVPAGTYYIKVNEYENYQGRYYLMTQIPEPAKPDAFESDDSIADAKDIQVGASQSRTFSSSADLDIARLIITRKGIYEIRARGIDENLDTVLEMIDSQEEGIAEDDDGGDRLDAYIRTVLSPGTYYIGVSTLNSDPIENNAYILSVSAAQ
jgi:hypothetical protein